MNSPPHWRRIFIALVLALVIGNAGPTPPVQAAPAGLSVTFYMDVVSPKTTVCVGETVNYEARVYMRYHPPLITPKGNTIDQSNLSGVKVEAFSQEKSVGDFTNTRNGYQTRTTGGADELVRLDNGEPLPHSAIFTFQGKKAGKTILRFEGLAYGQYVSFNVPVKVINCKYKVNVISNWFIVQGTGGSISLVSLIRGATLTAVSEDQFMGETTARWIPNIVLPSACIHSDTVPQSKATLTGGLNTSDELVVKVVFAPAFLTEVGACPPQDINTTNVMTPDTLTVTVPSAGGTWQGTQLLNSPSGLIPGHVTVIVTPVER